MSPLPPGRLQRWKEGTPGPWAGPGRGPPSRGRSWQPLLPSMVCATSAGKGASKKRVLGPYFSEKEVFAEREINADGEAGAIGCYRRRRAGPEPRAGRDGRQIPLLPPRREQQMLGLQGAGRREQRPSSGNRPQEPRHNCDPRCDPWEWRAQSRGSGKGGSSVLPSRPGSGLKVRERQLAQFPHGPGLCT